MENREIVVIHSLFFNFFSLLLIVKCIKQTFDIEISKCYCNQKYFGTLIVIFLLIQIQFYEKAHLPKRPFFSFCFLRQNKRKNFNGIR